MNKKLKGCFYAVWCSPPKSGAGCADGFAAKQAPTTQGELENDNK